MGDMKYRDGHRAYIQEQEHHAESRDAEGVSTDARFVQDGMGFPAADEMHLPHVAGA